MARRVQELAEEILTYKTDFQYDVFLRGMVTAYREMLSPKPEENLPDLETIEEQDENEV